MAVRICLDRAERRRDDRRSETETNAMLKSGAFWFSLAILVGQSRSCPAEQVVISRIQSEPRAAQPQYIELYNITSNPFDIAQWRLGGGVGFAFPEFATNQPKTTFLRPFERIVIAASEPAVAREAFNIPESVRVFGPWTGKLK